MSAASAGRPLDAAAFAALMAPLGPFEARPRLAVAVSGGPDSMALMLLAAAWAGSRGGAAIGLTVDHALRPDSAGEAATVGRWLAARGLEHHVLARQGPRPRRGIQAAARAARYGLLEGWCAEAGVLHLLLAHHREDQAETLLLRLAGGSGPLGLAAMPAVAERASVRLLRPLLPVARAQLRATLEAAGQPWIEDPSNRDTAYARVRLRAAAGRLAAAGLDAASLARAAAGFGRLRRALETRTADQLAIGVSLGPAGTLRLDRRWLLGLPRPLRDLVLARCLAHVGGAARPPRSARLARLATALEGSGRVAQTLGGCRVIGDARTVRTVRETQNRGRKACKSHAGPPTPLCSATFAVADHSLVIIS